jgi:hypothetical protein
LATLSSAHYVLKRFGPAEILGSRNEVLAYSLGEAKLEGLVLEFGVWEGNSLALISEIANQDVHGFDSFEGLPEYWRAGFIKGHFAVQNIPSFKSNVKLHVGIFSETVPEFLEQLQESHKSIRFIHIDSDLYSSARDILCGLSSAIGSGTVILFDEYFNFPGWEKGEYLAFKEFCKEYGREYRYLAYNQFHEQVSIVML